VPTSGAGKRRWWHLSKVTGDLCRVGKNWGEREEGLDGCSASVPEEATPELQPILNQKTEVDH